MEENVRIVKVVETKVTTYQVRNPMDPKFDSDYVDELMEAKHGKFHDDPTSGVSKDMEKISCSIVGTTTDIRAKTEWQLANDRPNPNKKKRN